MIGGFLVPGSGLRHQIAAKAKRLGHILAIVMVHLHFYRKVWEQEMRFGWILLAALFTASCGQSDVSPEGATGPASGMEAPASTAPGQAPAEAAPTDYAALSGYDDSWFLSPGWPGEYPPGFAVLDAEVRVPARARPNPTDPQDITCNLPQYANYQLWNNVRNDADDLDYFVATKKLPVTVLEDTEVEYVGEAGIETLALKAGEQLTYLRYIGEGFTVMSFNGREFEINEGELREITDIGALENEEDLWVRVNCLGGKQAWLLFDEVVQEEGVYPSPITGYGEAHDILPEEVETVREMMAIDAYGLDPTASTVEPPPVE